MFITTAPRKSVSIKIRRRCFVAAAKRRQRGIKYHQRNCLAPPLKPFVRIKKRRLINAPTLKCPLLRRLPPPLHPQRQQVVEHPPPLLLRPISSCRTRLQRRQVLILPTNLHICFLHRLCRNNRIIRNSNSKRPRRHHLSLWLLQPRPLLRSRKRT